MQTFCAVMVAVHLMIGLLRLLYHDINGRSAKPPTGFEGVVTSLLAAALQALLLYGAGAFDVFR